MSMREENRKLAALRSIAAVTPKQTEKLIDDIDDAPASERHAAIGRLRQFLSMMRLDLELPARRDMGDEFQSTKLHLPKAQYRHEKSFLNGMLGYVVQEISLDHVEQLKKDLGLAKADPKPPSPRT